MLVVEMFINLCASLFSRPTAHRLVGSVSRFYYRTFARLEYLRVARTVKGAFQGQKTAGQAKQIARSGFTELCWFLTDFQYMVNRPAVEVLRFADDLQCLGIENVDRALRTGRPLIAVSIHMGSFLLGFLKLGQIVPRGTKVTVIKLNEWSRRETAAYKHFEKNGHALRILRLSEKPGLEALRELRSGGIVLALCDIDPDWAKTTSLEFFNKPARFPVGLAELAIACRGIIVPIFSGRDEQNKPFVRIESPLEDTNAPGNSDIRLAAERLTQQLAGRAEGWIRKYPDQWHFWPALEKIWQPN